MRRSGFTYIGKGRARQSLSASRVVLVASLAIYLFGCAGIGPSADGQANIDSSMATGSIEQADSKEQRTVAPSDWEAVRRSIARATSDDSFDGVMAWVNPDTGSTGTLKVLDAATATNQSDCRDFETTVNDVRGIRHYRGEACRTANDRWELFDVLADDSELL